MGGHATTGVVAVRVSVGWRQRLSRALPLPPGCGSCLSASVCRGWRNRPDHCRDQARCAEEPHKGPEFDGLMRSSLAAERPSFRATSGCALLWLACRTMPAGCDWRGAAERAAAAACTACACALERARRRSCLRTGALRPAPEARERVVCVLFARGPRAAQGRPETELRCRSRLRRPVLHSDQRACAYRRASGRRPTPCVACTRRRWDAEGSGNALREAPP